VARRGDDIVVSDGHGAGGINPLLLDQRAKLLRGWPNGWPLELDESYGAVVWIGQHAKASTPRAHLAHTQWFNYLDLSINGVSIGEFGQFALCASELGIPAIFASGDEAFCQEATALIPGIYTIAVKRGLQPDDGRDLDTRAYMRHNLSALHLHPEVARRAIRETAKAALLHLNMRPKAMAQAARSPIRARTEFARRAGQPYKRDRATHPSSVIALLNLPFSAQPY
jgi:D-aminopeptidase